MADAFVGVVLRTLNSLIEEEIGSIIGVDKEMKKLASILTAIQAVLLSAEQMQFANEPIRIWLINLKELSHEIDDILDECAAHVSKSKRTTIGLKKFLDKRNFAKKIKDVTEKLDAVAAERQYIHLPQMNPPAAERTSSRNVPASRQTCSNLIDINSVLGREDEKRKIVDVLVNRRANDNQNISILPIVGLGGLGKTTLAQLVYKDERVIQHFETKLWVCVSDNFDLETLIRAMIESASSGKSSASNLTSLEALTNRLHEFLNEKRFLVVLDDVWNDEQEEWDKLKNVLSCGSEGSAIITTTRSSKVAEIMGTLPAHDLEKLSEEHCWTLLKRRAFFGQEEEDRFPDLVDIGKQIVKKCGGVPLAANALGGLLRFKRDEKEWVYVKDSEIWDLPEETLILPALRLSYLHLPPEMRQCFAYCSIFPKDTSIGKEELIFLWMAHGYISSSRSREAEDEGEHIWDELILRSLFQNAVDYSGVKLMNKVVMHDLVHDLATSIMENRVPGSQLERIRTSSASSNTKIRQINLYERTVAFPKSCSQPDMDISLVIKNYSRLRVLDASYFARKIPTLELPSTLGNLKHLRLLNLSNTNIRSLPKKLCSLWNLQTLILSFCGQLVKFPKNMRRLKNLRHLLLDYCRSLTETPYNLRELTHLRTLSMFIVGSKKGTRLEELQSLNLGGLLEILHLERVAAPEDAEKANLVQKDSIRRLSLGWESNTAASGVPRDTDEKVLEALEPHSNIECFGISGFSGRRFANWIIDMKKLLLISITDCPHLLSLPKLEDLPLLESLQLHKLAKLKFIGEGGNSQNVMFPSLKSLRLYSLPNLKRLFDGEVGEMCPDLEELHVQKCPSLELDQLPQRLEKFNKWTCDSTSCLNTFRNLDNVTRLEVTIGENMTCIPGDSLQRLRRLKSLHVFGANEQCLPVNGLQGLVSLEELEIKFSRNLTCLPEGWLRHTTSLKVLWINICAEFTDLHLPSNIGHLNSLIDISFHHLPKMERIPEAIRRLSCLKTLDLLELPELASLPDWLGELTGLDKLRIVGCRKLAELPYCIQGMSNLRQLHIDYCPELARRCQRGRGDDWDKIAHIPSRVIRGD